MGQQTTTNKVTNDKQQVISGGARSKKWQVRNIK
jgi:hypothetical protein